MAKRPTLPPRRRRLSRTLVPAFCAFGVFIVVWYLVSTLYLSPEQQFLLPTPTRVVTHGFGDAQARTEMFAALWATAKVMLVGLAIATLLGITLAVVMSQAKWLELSLYPWAVVLQTIPVLALVPVIGFWFGYDLTARLIICVIIALFPIITNTLAGLQSAESSLFDLFRLSRSGRFVRLVKLQFPSALPSIFIGLRVSAGLSLVGAIVADYFFRQGPGGIGRLLDTYRANLSAEPLFASIILSCGFGVLVFWFFGVLGNLVTRSWRTTGESS